MGCPKGEGLGLWVVCVRVKEVRGIDDVGYDRIGNNTIVIVSN